MGDACIPCDGSITQHQGCAGSVLPAQGNAHKNHSFIDCWADCSRFYFFLRKVNFLCDTIHSNGSIKKMNGKA
jgi:hypothetical protein